MTIHTLPTADTLRAAARRAASAAAPGLDDLHYVIPGNGDTSAEILALVKLVTGREITPGWPNRTAPAARAALRRWATLNPATPGAAAPTAEELRDMCVAREVAAVQAEKRAKQPRGFGATLADYSTAGTYQGAEARAAADRLPLSEWSEARRDLLTPQTVALNWRANVADTAHELRELLTAHDNGGSVATVATIKASARDLLRALGEIDDNHVTPGASNNGSEA